jgi:FkbM family methyltransferase
MAFHGYVNKLLGLANLRVIGKPPASGLTFFEPHVSCQIPYLGFIYERVFGPTSMGSLVEVGAYDGEYLSNSSCLLERGWSGLLVEPVPHLAQSCRERYSSRTDINIHQSAVGDIEATVTMHFMGTMSTISPDLKEEVSKRPWAKGLLKSAHDIEVEVQTLDRILQQYGTQQGFDLLIVDVEGYEAQVMNSFNLDFWQPKMIIIELADFHPFQDSGRIESSTTSLSIESSGYRIIYKDFINTIFLRKELIDV